MKTLNNGEQIYNSKWQRRRLIFLKLHPLCCFCSDAGRVVVATVVDHKTPHRGDEVLFWNEDNWQSLCKKCHDGAKQREEKRGFSGVVSDDGWPIDKNHPANTGHV